MAEIIPESEQLDEELDQQQQDEEWRRGEGIPEPHDIQKFYESLDALKTQEDKHRSDLDFRQLLSPMAQEACAIVSQIRYEELQTLWAEAEKLPPGRSPQLHPEMPFPLGRDVAEKSKLFRIVKEIPKGALLHCHLEAMVDLEWLYRTALETDGIHICSTESLHTAESRKKQCVVFAWKSQPQATDASTLWHDGYQPDSWVSLKAAAASFPDGGAEGMIKWLVSISSLTTEEMMNPYLGQNAIWAKFQNSFSILSTVIYYEPIFRKFMARFFQQLVDDKIYWVDMRSAFKFLFFKENSEMAENGYSEYFKVLGEEIEKFKATEAGKSFWGARMIWTSIRAFSDRDIVENMKECIKNKVEYPHLISGYDLVGQEDPGRTLEDLTPILFYFRKKCAENQVNIPFFFHAGETTTTGSPTDLNLFTAIALGTRRIGHGFSLYKHPLLMNMCKDRRIVVECCPISNELLRLCSTVNHHPALPALIAHGVPVSLNNDDPAILCRQGPATAGVSHDFYQSLQGHESLGLEGLGAMAENSVRWAAYEDLGNQEWTEDLKKGMYGTGVRAKRMKEWKSQWEKFCQWVVLEFGADMDLEPDD